MSKEHAYAYEAGYRDGSIHYELEHCPACKNVADLQEALAENAMLREQLAKARDPQRIGGTADPESFVYAIEQLREFRWQHATNDEEAIPYINNVADAHERENAKLRELVRDMFGAYKGTVEMLPSSYSKNVAERAVMDISDRMRELGVDE